MTEQRLPLPYSRLSIALHWLMVLLIAATFASIELRGLFERGSEMRTFVKQMHFMLGMSIFFLVWVRLLARLVHKGPASPTKSPEEILAKLVHLALYGLMIALPLVGWLMFSAEGKGVPFFGLELPPLIGPSEKWEDRLEELHEGLGVAGYWLIGLHAAAALLHHYVRRDEVMARMLPVRR